jgi:hypothetical protein
VESAEVSVESRHHCVSEDNSVGKCGGKRRLKGWQLFWPVTTRRHTRPHQVLYACTQNAKQQ